MHNATLPFTRNVIGPMDYTPVTFSDSQHPHTTSYGHELALAVLFESGIQHFADRPSAFEDLPEAPKEFLKNERVDGYPGERVIMARRKGDTWYIGGINGLKEEQDLTVDFSFLDSGEYNFELIKEGEEKRSFATQSIEISSESQITISCLQEGGFVGILEKMN